MSYPSWHAVEALDEAMDDAKELFLPIDKGTWLRMILIVFLTGGLFTSILAPGPVETGTTDLQGLENNIQQPNQITGGTALLVIGAIAGTITLLGYISSVFQFIFFQTVKDGEPMISSGFSKHWLNGIKYLAFRTAIALLTITLYLALLGTLSEGGLLLGIMALTLLVPVWITISLISFTFNNYAIPHIVEKEAGFTEAFTRALNVFYAQWKQAAVYIIVAILLNIVIAVLLFSMLSFVFLALAIPAFIFTLAAFAINPVIGLLSMIVEAIVAFAIILVAATPLRTYLTQWIYETYTNFEAK